MTGCTSYQSSGSYSYSGTGYATSDNIYGDQVSVNLDMYAPIILLNNSNLPLVADVYQVLDPVFPVVPAVFIKFLKDKEFENQVGEALQAVAVLADVITLATGPGLIWKAWRASKYLLAVYEGSQVVASTANIIVNATGADSELVDAFNLIITGWGITRGGTQLFNKWSDFKYTLDDLDNQVFHPASSTEANDFINKYHNTPPELRTPEQTRLYEYLSDQMQLLDNISSIDEFLSLAPKIENISPNSIPSGYQIVTLNGSKYIRRIDTSNPNTPRLMVDNTGTIVLYSKPERLASNGLLRSRLGEVNGGIIPDGHQAHHLVPDNVVQNSPIHQEAINRGLYDLDRVSNGRLLAETAEDYVSLSEAYPTHFGSHPSYDDAIRAQIDDLVETNDIDIFNLGTLSDSELEAIINAIENRALNVLINWQPSRLN